MITKITRGLAILLLVAGSVMAQPKLPPIPKVTGTNRVTVPAVKTGPVGRSVPTGSTTLAWLDSSLTDTNVVGFMFFYGTKPLQFTNVLTITNWLSTNGLAEITLANLNPNLTYYGDLVAFDRNRVESAVSQSISFIVPGWLQASAGGVIRFQGMASNTMTLQSESFTPSNTTHLAINSLRMEAQTGHALVIVTNSSPWNNELTVVNTGQIVTFTNAQVGKFYRLQVK